MSRNKNVKNFKQTDDAWASILYPKKPDDVANSGCGATACADLIVTNPKHKKITPDDTARWMVKHGYAIPGQGTAWAGITGCLKAYGFKVKQHDDMTSFWAEMKKSGRMAVISFRGGTKGGITWTLGGHFLACSGMEIKNGQHRLYMLDPGPRNHNGWYIYETHMRGLIAQLWTCYLPEKKESTNEAKKEEKVKKKTMKELVAYAKKRAKETHKYKSGWSWKTGLMCHAFVAKCYKDCGYSGVYKRMRKKGFYKKPWADKYLGPYYLKHKKGGLTSADLIGGDIVASKLFRNGKHIGWHTALYVGGGKVGEATSKHGTHIGKLGTRFKYAFRVPEPHSAKYEVVKTRSLRETWSSKSASKMTLKKGTKFKTSYRRGNWVKVVKIYDEKSKKWVKSIGWVYVKGKEKICCKKIK